jgi:lipopolysaccharide/colanic/teichoic acid biosynthesis glycosyltransferase
VNSIEVSSISTVGSGSMDDWLPAITTAMKSPFEQWMNLDLQYIDNWSLKLDFVILFKTIGVVFSGEGR